MAQTPCEPCAADVLCFRLGPGAELKSAVLKQGAAALQGRPGAVWVQTCVGSLTSCRLRLANAEAGKANDVLDLNERFEILSLVGTINISEDGSPSGHLHISLGDKTGRCIGGHLLGDATIFTTAEIVLGVSHNVSFTRAFDERTGYPELKVQPLGTQSVVDVRDIVVATGCFALGFFARRAFGA